MMSSITSSICRKKGNGGDIRKNCAKQPKETYGLFLPKEIMLFSLTLRSYFLLKYQHYWRPLVLKGGKDDICNQQLVSDY